MPTATLAPYTNDPLLRARRWTDLSYEDRKRRAATAARDRDSAELWSLLEARLLVHGSAGALISPHTLRSYRAGLTELLAAFQGENLLHPTPDSGALWLRALEQHGKSASTVGVRLAAARALYRGLRWSGATTDDPFGDARAMRDMVPAHAKRLPYSESDMTALLSAATGEDRILVLLCGHAGLRNAEALALKWEHVDLNRRTLRVVEGKGRKTADVTMSRTLTETLVAAAPTSDFVIAGYRSTEAARQRIRALCARANVTNRGIHSLRHYAGTKVQIQLGDIRQVARHLRHSSTATAEIYVLYADHALEDALADW